MALLVVDMLKDFIKEGAVLEVPAGRRIVGNIRRLIDAFHEKGWPVVFVCDAHLKDDGEFKYWPPHAIKGTEGAAVIEELKPSEDDIVIEKRRYSGFFETQLDLTLRERNVKTVVVTGVLTDVCVFFTAADAFMRGYEVVLVEDACAALSDEEHRWALKQAEAVLKAKIVKTGELLKQI